MGPEFERVKIFKERMASLDSSTNVRASLLLDTNVMLEIYTIVDMLRLADELGSPEAARRSPTFSYRQERARNSIVLAYHLAKRHQSVGVLGAEVVKILEKLIPDPKAGEDGTAFIFTTAVVQVVREFALRDLKIGALTNVDHDAHGTTADTELLNEAKSKKLPLITWEGITEAGFSDSPKSLRNRGLKEKVAVFSPTEYLACQKVNVQDEAWRFVFACTKAVREARQKGVFAERRDILESIVPMYRFILLDEVSDELSHVPRG